MINSDPQQSGNHAIHLDPHKSVLNSVLHRSGNKSRDSSWPMRKNGTRKYSDPDPHPPGKVLMTR